MNAKAPDDSTCSSSILGKIKYFITSFPHTPKTMMYQIHDIHSEEIAQKVCGV